MDLPATFAEAETKLFLLRALLHTRRPEIQEYAATLEARRDDLPQLMRLLFEEEERTREEVRKILDCARDRCFVVEPTSSAALYFLSRRCDCALNYLGECYPPQSIASPVRDAEWPPERVWPWLLDDLWVRRRDSYLKLQALWLHGPFPWFGLEAATEGE